MELELIRQADPEVADAIGLELNRQRTHVELIASENFVSPAVMAAMGTCLTNKYAEGYPGKRYCLSNGGHLTHGSPVNMSGSYFNFVPYGVSSETETIDYDEVRRLAKENNPKLIVAGASAYPRVIDF